MPRSNSFCASGLHEVSKCTWPSFLSSVWPRADRVSETPVAATAAMANDDLFMVLLLVGGADPIHTPFAAVRVRGSTDKIGGPRAPPRSWLGGGHSNRAAPPQSCATP